MRNGRLIWIVVDGVPLWLLRRYAHRHDRIPLVADHLARGAVSALIPVMPNCQTPPSLFTLFSGLSPSVHGLTGFEIPDPDRQHSLLSLSAFRHYPSETLMIWDHVARNQQTVRLCQMPFVSRERLGVALLSATNQFTAPTIPASVTPLTAGASGQTLPSPEIRLRNGASGCLLSVPGESDQIVPRGSWTAVALENGLRSWAGVHKVDGCWSLILLGAWPITPCGRTASRSATQTKPNLYHDLPFASGAICSLFRKNALGERLIDGGDGHAEMILADALGVLSKRFWAEACDAVRCDDADLVVAYQPSFDLLLHEILGLVDETSDHYQEQSAAIADALLLDALSSIDRGLSHLRSLCGDKDRLFVCSDHGMMPIDQVVRPNVELHRMGLLKSDGARIDLERSVAFFHPAETGLVCFDEGELERRGASREGVMDDLSKAISHRTGRPSGWTSFIPPSRRGGGCDLYLVPGTGQTAKATIADALFIRSNKTADHCTTSANSHLRGIALHIGAAAPSLPPEVQADSVMHRLMGAA